ncbi:MAG: hypothetical protein ACF8OB_16050 [Phycisphaeraceae bacterium JB051]
MNRLSKLATLVIAAVLGLSSLANAQTGPSLITKPFEEGKPFEVEVSAQLQEKDQLEDFLIGTFDQRLSIYDAQGRWQITQDDLGLTFGTQLTVLDTNPRTIFQNPLMDQSFALGMNIGQLAQGKLSAVVGFGYNGSEPYRDGNAWYGKADLIWTHKASDTSMWQVILDYNGNRSFLSDWPLPSIAYTDWSNPQLTWTLGLPYSSLTWEPDDKWEIELGAVLIYDINARVSYELLEGLEIYTEYASRTDAFMPAEDLPMYDSDERLFFEQQTVELGLVWEPCEEFELTVAGGYAFDQQITHGDDINDADEEFGFAGEKLIFGDAPYLRIAAEVKF